MHYPLGKNNEFVCVCACVRACVCVCVLACLAGGKRLTLDTVFSLTFPHYCLCNQSGQRRSKFFEQVDPVYYRHLHNMQGIEWGEMVHVRERERERTSIMLARNKQTSK